MLQRCANCRVTLRPTTTGEVLSKLHGTYGIFHLCALCGKDEAERIAEAKTNFIPDLLKVYLSETGSPNQTTQTKELT